MNYCCNRKAAPPKPEIRRVAVISTAHVTKQDAAFLNDPELHKPGVPAFTLFGEYGWQFAVPAVDDTERCRKEFADLGFSEAIPNTLIALRDRGFDRVEFDSDGPKIDLPVFEW